MKRSWLYAGSGIAVCAMTAAVVVSLWPQPMVPAEIERAVTSTLYLPEAVEVQVDRDSMKLDGELKLLTYDADVYGVPTVFSQQPTPESFVDVPQVYDRVVESMNDYAKFDSTNGTVYLTRPTDLGGKQAAVMNSKGTLLFIKPDRDLSADQWRRLFNNLEVVR